MRLRNLLLVFAAPFVFGITFAKSQETKLISLTKYATKAYVNDSVEVSLYTSTMFRFRISHLPGNKFPAAYDIPFAIGKLDNWETVKFKMVIIADTLNIETSALRLSISLKTLQWRVFSLKGNLVYPSYGPIYGMFKDGYTIFDNASSFDEKNNNSRYPHWFYSTKADNYVTTYLEEDLIDEKYFIYGPDYTSIFRQYNQLVGPEPLLPQKSYGFSQTQHLGCDGSQSELLDVARRFRSEGIPCDNLIIDFEWGDGCDGNKEITWGSSLDWNKNYSVPLTPAQMIDSLHNMHFSVMLIHHNAPDFKTRKHQGWTESVYPDSIWWKKLYETLDIGIDGTWQDTRKNGITDSYIYGGIQKYYGESRRVSMLRCRKMMLLNYWDNYPCTIPVNEMTGNRRYPFAWTEDISFSWKELEFQIKAITNSQGSLKAINYLTADGIGYDWKLQARWNQFLSFCAVARSHNPKPWSGNINTDNFLQKIKIEDRKDAKSTTEEKSQTDLSETALLSYKTHLDLRYKLLPYIYSYSFQNFLSGMPVCRPMLLAFPGDFRCSADQWPLQYMFGEWLLVAPVYGDFKTMEIYLPEGFQWIDYWSKEVYVGGKILEYDVTDINKLPLFIKKGAVLPMQPASQWIEPGKPYHSLIVDIYPFGSGSFDLYEDDGISMAYTKGQYRKTSIHYDDLKDGIDITFSAKGIYKDMPVNQTYRLNLYQIDRIPKGVISFNGKPLNETEKESGISGWSYDPVAKLLRVTIECLTEINDSLAIDKLVIRYE